jgi:hypothetical protein
MIIWELIVHLLVTVQNNQQNTYFGYYSMILLGIPFLRVVSRLVLRKCADVTEERAVSIFSSKYGGIPSKTTRWHVPFFINRRSQNIKSYLLTFINCMSTVFIKRVLYSRSKHFQSAHVLTLSIPAMPYGIILFICP